MADWYDLGGTIGGSVLSGIFGAIGTNRQAKLNARMMREAQAFTKSEREASQSWQDAQRRMQNQYSEAMYNKYSSPQAMAQQYLAAGLNPKLAVNGSQLGTGASSGSSGGAPSGEVIAAPYQSLGSGTQSFQSIAQGISGIASAFKSIAEAKKAGVETTQMEAFFNKKFEGLALSVEAQKLRNIFNEYTLPVRQAHAIATLIQDIENGDLTNQELKSRIKGLDLTNDRLKKEVDNWESDFQNRQENIKSNTELNRSQISLNKVREATERTTQILQTTQANLNKVLQTTEYKHGLVYDSQVKLNNSITELNDLTAKIKDATKWEEIDANRDTYNKLREKNSLEIQNLQQEYERLKKENKYKEASEIAGIAMKWAITFSQATSGLNSIFNMNRTATKDAAEAGDALAGAASGSIAFF